MSILRLIISILFPPIGLFINLGIEKKSKLDKINTIISIILTVVFVALIIFFIVVINLNNKKENELLKCRSPYYCEPSTEDYQTCYYCKNGNCKDLEKIRCVTNEDIFNYSTVDNPEDE